MKLFSQIIIFLLTFFTSSATFSAPKIVVPTSTSIFQKTEKITLSEKAKIGLEIPKTFGIARSSISEYQTQTTTFHQNTFSLSSFLKSENPCALDFQKTVSQSQLSVTENSSIESLNELENRARVRNVNVVDGAGSLESFLLQQAKIQESLTLLKNKNLVSKFAGASEVQASSIHRYTVSSFELNGKLNKGLTLTEYETKWLQSIKEGLDEMRKTKKYVGNVFRGQTLDETLVLQKYVNPYNQAKAIGGPALVEENALLSCTKDNTVADYFVQLSKNKIKNGEAGVSVKFNIKSKRGVDIDDISDYGKNLCSGNPKCQQIQQEILLENGTFKINDVQKTTENG